MKHRRIVYFLFAACSLFQSCANDKEESSYFGEGEQTITALFESDSKTSVNDDWVTTWSSNDALSVFLTKQINHSNGVKHLKFSYNKGKFKNNSGESLDSPYNWFVIYPYTNYSQVTSPAVVTINHPASQTQEGDTKAHISGDNDPLYGIAKGIQSNPTVKMHHIASTIVIRVRNTGSSPIKVSEVEFSAPTKIAGKFTSSIDLYDQNFEKPVWNADGNSAVSTVTLNVNNGKELKKDQTGDFLIAVHPFSAEGEYTIKVTAEIDGESVEYEKSAECNLSFKAGKYKVIEFDFVEKPLSQSLDIENKWLKQYLDAVDANPYFTTTEFGSWDTSYKDTRMTTSMFLGGSEKNRYDQPAPVILVWSGSATKIEIFSDQARTSSVMTKKLSGSKNARIYNLIPGKEYYYTATDGLKTIAEDSFIPSGRRRMMAISSNYSDKSACNSRDLGGLKTNDGKQLKYGIIYRGSNIDNILNDPEAVEIFTKDMNIKLDVDLRETGNREGAPDLSEYGIYLATERYRAYISELTDKTKMKATLERIMNYVIEGKPVYIHCRIGSDRTGYVCLLLESLLGVSQNECDKDYEITSFAYKETGPRVRIEKNPPGITKNYNGGIYKDGIKHLGQFSGTTLADKAYDYVVTSEQGLQIDAELVSNFRKAMLE